MHFFFFTERARVRLLYELIFSHSGASGGGKSSVHSLLLRYYDPIHGKITFDGKGLTTFTTSLNGSQIVSQIFEYFPQHLGVR